MIETLWSKHQLHHGCKLAHRPGKDKKIATAGDGIADFAGFHGAAPNIPDPLFYVEWDGAPGLDLVAEVTPAYKYLQRLGWGKAV